MSGYLRRILARQVIRGLKRSRKFDAAGLTEIQKSITKSLSLAKVNKNTKSESLAQFVLKWNPVDISKPGADVTVSNITESLATPSDGDEDLRVDVLENDDSKLHLRLQPDVFGKHILLHILEYNTEYGYHGETVLRGDNSGETETVVVEFSSPNIAKPFHVGHLRSTIIGNFLANLYERLGYHVVRLNYLGDWGTQFGILCVGFQRYGDLNKLDSNAMEHLLEVYIKINQDIAGEGKEGETTQLARETFRRMEEGDEEILGLWRKFRDLTINELKPVYKRLGVEFTEYHGESMYRHRGAELIERFKRAGLLQIREDGKSIVTVDTIPSPMNEAVILKSDGTSLYITRDVLALLDRLQKYNFKKIHYIVENGQHMHFRHLLGLVRLLEPQSHRLGNDLHVSFGRVRGMQTRKGEVVFLRDVLNEAKNQMLEKILSKETTKISENIEDIADILGVSAVIVQDLSQRRSRDYRFSWERSVNVKSNSGISLQYTHARLSSLEQNCGLTLAEKDFDPQHLVIPEAQFLLIHLARYEDAVEMAFKSLEPYLIVRYLYLLCHFINVCYRNLPVKGQETEIAQARLHLFHASRITLANGMRLLGLTLLEKL